MDGSIRLNDIGFEIDAPGREAICKPYFVRGMSEPIDTTIRDWQNPQDEPVPATKQYDYRVRLLGISTDEVRGPTLQVLVERWRITTLENDVGIPIVNPPSMDEVDVPYGLNTIPLHGFDVDTWPAQPLQVPPEWRELAEACYVWDDTDPYDDAYRDFDPLVISGPTASPTRRGLDPWDERAEARELSREYARANREPWEIFLRRTRRHTGSAPKRTRREIPIRRARQGAEDRKSMKIESPLPRDVSSRSMERLNEDRERLQAIRNLEKQELDVLKPRYYLEIAVGDLLRQSQESVWDAFYRAEQDDIGQYDDFSCDDGDGDGDGDDGYYDHFYNRLFDLCDEEAEEPIEREPVIEDDRDDGIGWECFEDELVDFWHLPDEHTEARALDRTHTRAERNERRGRRHSHTGRARAKDRTRALIRAARQGAEDRRDKPCPSPHPYEELVDEAERTRAETIEKLLATLTDKVRQLTSELYPSPASTCKRYRRSVAKSWLDILYPLHFVREVSQITRIVALDQAIKLTEAWLKADAREHWLIEQAYSQLWLDLWLPIPES